MLQWFLSKCFGGKFVFAKEFQIFRQNIDSKICFIARSQSIFSNTFFHDFERRV
jgi:hypothetical protein